MIPVITCCSVDEVLREAEKLVRNGVKELLVVSQDTSAYGVDLKYSPREWNGRQYETRMKALCEGLGELAAGADPLRGAARAASARSASRSG